MSAESSATLPSFDDSVRESRIEMKKYCAITQELMKNPDGELIIVDGYNPVYFSPSLDELEKKELLRILAILGDCPEIDEDKLEAYGIVDAMGPTYLWFQIYELERIGMTFGLTIQEIRRAVSCTAEGSAKTMNESNLNPAEVMNLIPVKPLGEDEEKIKGIYHTNLEALFKKLKS